MSQRKVKLKTPQVVKPHWPGKCIAVSCKENGDHHCMCTNDFSKLYEKVTEKVWKPALRIVR